MKAKSFKRAVELLKRLDFEEFEVNDSISYISTVDGKKVYQNWFQIYMDDDNGTYTAELRENGKYFLTYDGDVVCLISGEIAEKLDALRDEELAKKSCSSIELYLWDFLSVPMIFSPFFLNIIDYLQDH